MWHKPQLLTAIADLLWLVGGAILSVVLVLGVTRLPLFPLRELAITAPLQETRRADIERAVAGQLRGNFFTVRPERVRDALEKLPWVRKAQVRRRWPGALEVAIEEHRAVARWGEGAAQLVNTHGEVFYGVTRQLPALVLAGPTGAAPDVLARHAAFADALRPTGRTVRQVALSSRLAWRIVLDDGMVIELGQEQDKAPIVDRLKRFAATYEEVIAGRTPPPAVADLRYPNGFALRLAAANAAGQSEPRGNP